MVVGGGPTQKILQNFDQLCGVSGVLALELIQIPFEDFRQQRSAAGVWPAIQKDVCEIIMDFKSITPLIPTNLPHFYHLETSMESAASSTTTWHHFTQVLTFNRHSFAAENKPPVFFHKQQTLSSHSHPPIGQHLMVSIVCCSPSEAAATTVPLNGLPMFSDLKASQAESISALVCSCGQCILNKCIEAEASGTIGLKCQ